MKINELKINSYGKLKDKNVNFSDGINIVYGENEKGKSTLLNCIVNMFYGTSKNKKGREISDFDKFKPWDSDEFSGKISYTLDNNESFEVFREFGKKNPKIYNKDMEDISKDFSIDKNTGNQFFLEQTKIDEKTFTSTMVSFQNEIEIDDQTQNILLQKIANTSSTGAENISYKKAIDKLNKKQLEEIGTNRTQEKPINIVTNELSRLKNTNESLKKYQDYKYEIEDKKYKIENELKDIENKNDFLNKLNNINQKQNVENEKVRYNEGKIDELEDKIQKLIDKKEEIQGSSKKINANKNVTEKLNKTPYMVAILGSLILCIMGYIFTRNIIAIVPLIIAIISIILMIKRINKIDLKNKELKKQYDEDISFNKDIEKNIYEIDAQIEILEKNQKEQVYETENIKNEIIKSIEQKREHLKIEYSNKINSSSMSYFCNAKNLSYEMDQNLRLMNEKNMELHRLILDKENIMPRLDEIVENEEKIASLESVYEELIHKNNAINMAKEIIEISYKKMKNDVTPKFTESLSKNIAYITNNKYQKIVINEEDGLLVELANGEYKNANFLSKGTIEQLYLAFRLSLIEDITEESMPIIFDEAFAYFDDNRLKETLKSINNYSKKHQIILFTCTNREENILRELGLDYNKIVL